MEKYRNKLIYLAVLMILEGGAITLLVTSIINFTDLRTTFSFASTSFSLLVLILKAKDDIKYSKKIDYLTRQLMDERNSKEMFKDV